MSKTKSKTNQMTLVDEDPRVRMKQVRAEVAEAVKFNRRVDLMNYSGADVPRAMIALQDLLAKEKQKHAKARGHIMDRNESIEAMSEMLTLISVFATNKIIGDQEQLGQMAEEIRKLLKIVDDCEYKCNQARIGWQNAQDEVDQTNEKLYAAMQTIKTMSEGVDFA